MPKPIQTTKNRPPLSCQSREPDHNQSMLRVIADE